jgi:hypothetical protein
MKSDSTTATVADLATFRARKSAADAVEAAGRHLHEKYFAAAR